MSASRPITTTNNNSEDWVMIDWTQVLDNAIQYNTDEEEEEMKAKSKERKWQKVAEQAQCKEQVWLEAERVVWEKAEAERAEWERAKAERAEREAKEKKACEEEERWEAKCKCKGDEARGEVKKVVMDPSCTHCTQVNTVCEFLMDGNKKWVACIWCNQSKGKCWWPGDGKDTEAGPKAATKADKGKKWKADKESPEPGPSQKKWVKSKPTEVLEIDKPKASGSRVRKTGLITNNLAGLFELQEATVEHSSQITNALNAMLDESYGFGMAVTPSDLGLSELNSDELCEEAEWLRAKGEEEEAEGEDEPMAEAK
ncbi:hypothetical protein M404DRAFT_31725 [Pisolithus tinctorius Marx 270]|uniref:Uncharacterized protein n=1 Tax=Pisolithus tinctorius Marx 270 TaxID=870435 RepID=A0A0C3NR91_PISTI|nr:hypothetical protein M404DRAFT_31725 [Pisolithus tinctorius Marx 270]